MRLMRRTHLMRPMPLAVTNQQLPLIELGVDFDSSIQTLGALEAAAYRLLGIATCQIERVNDRFVCHLAAQTHPSRRDQLDTDSLKIQFLNLVADENLRVCPGSCSFLTELSQHEAD